MDARAQLALLMKAKVVFEAADTFLSLPVAPLPFVKRQLDFFSQKDAVDLAASLHHLQAFSQLVNLIPAGEAWVPTDSRFLWDAYRQVLAAEFAETSRTAAEEADFLRATSFLRETLPDGTWRDSAVVKAYKQHKDLWFLTEQRYAGLRATAEASPDLAERERWRTVDEPKERAHRDAVEQAWILDGHKREVEAAQATVVALGARSPMQAWQEWSGRFNRDLDTVTGTTIVGDVFPSSFAPTNALDDGAWVPFTLTGPEVDRLVRQAPDELLGRLDGAAPSTLTSLAFEFSSATIVRPWFTADAFRARFWRLKDGQPAISDGGQPARGECPAYVTAVVFARRVRETHAQPQPPSRPNDFGGFSPLRHDHFVMVRPTVPAPLEARREREAIAVRRRTETGLAVRRNADLRRHGHPAVGATRPGVVPPVTAAVSPAAMHVVPAPAPPAVSAATTQRLHLLREAAFTRLPSALPSVSAEQDAIDETIYVLAFICKKVGKCPDPDPTLQW